NAFTAHTAEVRNGVTLAYVREGAGGTPLLLLYEQTGADAGAVRARRPRGVPVVPAKAAAACIDCTHRCSPNSPCHEAVRGARSSTARAILNITGSPSAGASTCTPIGRPTARRCRA